MDKKNLLSNQATKRVDLGNSPTINDLREKEFKGVPLSHSEKLSLVNFDKFRIKELNAQLDDMSFHKRYRELQIMANLGSYTEFLDEKYSD
jgi:hypothetical protein